MPGNDGWAGDGAGDGAGDNAGGTGQITTTVTVIVITSTTTIANPTAPLEIYVGETGRAISITAQDVPFASVASAVVIFETAKTILPVTPFSGDTATFVDDGSGKAKCTYGLAVQGSTPVAGLYRVRFRMTLTGGDSAVDSPAYLLRVLPF